MSGAKNVQDSVGAHNSSQDQVTLSQPPIDRSIASLGPTNPLPTDKSSDPEEQQIELSYINEIDSKQDEIATEIVPVNDPKLKKVRQRLWTTVLSAIVACIPFLLVGCTLGFPSGALLDLTDLEERLEYKLTREQADLFGALGYIGAVFGGPIAGWISDRMGRKPALMLVSIPYLIGYLMITYARFASNSVLFKVVLLIGRFLSGVGIGWASLAATVYVLEISPAKLRGRMGSALQVFLALGVVIVYGLSAIDNFAYYDSSLVLIGFVTLFTISMPFFIETPRWLIAHGQKKQAIAALKFLRGPKYDFMSELDTITANIKSTPRLKPKQLLKEFGKGNVIVPMILVLFLVVFFQCGGLNSITTYSALIFKNAGVPMFRQAALYGTGCTRLLVNIIALFLTDLFGRKILLMVSSVGAMLGTTMLGVHFYITNPSFCSNTTSVIDPVSMAMGEDEVLCNPQFAPLAITAVIIFNIGFSIGWGPVIWLLLVELLPLQIRGIGSGIASLLLWGLASAVIGSYLTFVDAVQPWFVWWTYSAISLVSFFFVAFFIFETKGKSLEEIQKRFEEKYGQFKLCNRNSQNQRQKLGEKYGRYNFNRDSQILYN